MNSLEILVVSTMMCCAAAEFRPKLNVGTVLFGSDDLNKQKWNTNVMNLLQARMYFEDLVPTPRPEPLNEEYLIYLLEYFKDAYDTIKREAADPLTKHLMQNALSDVIGGHLKVWILPISKHLYYGGAASLDVLLKCNEVYNSIKNDLDTNGEGWNKPDDSFVRNIAVNIAALNNLMKTKDGNCDDLKYYEKHDSEFKMPVPIVNWNAPTAIFLPLENQSLIPLDSVNSSTAVIQFYNLIQSCVINTIDLNNFNERFQRWLADDVVPHLDDEELYTPFGGVLSLLNKTRLYRQMYEKPLDEYNFSRKKPRPFCERWNICGKKLILLVILLIEIIWCIPTLAFIIFCKNRKKKAPWSMFLCFKAGNNKNKYYVNSVTSDSDNETDRLTKEDQKCNNVLSFKKFETIHSSINERNKQEAKDEKYFNAMSHHELSGVKENTPTESKPLLQANSKPRVSHQSQHKVGTELKKKETDRDALRLKQIKEDKSENSTELKGSERVIQNFTYSQFQMQETPPAQSTYNIVEKKRDKKDLKNKSVLTVKPPETVKIQIRKSEKKITSSSKDKSVTEPLITNKGSGLEVKQRSNKNNIDNENYTDDKRNAIKPKKKERGLYKSRKTNLEDKKEDETFLNCDNDRRIDRDICKGVNRDIGRDIAKDIYKNIDINHSRVMDMGVGKDIDRSVNRDVGRDLSRDIKRDFIRDIKRDINRDIERPKRVKIDTTQPETVINLGSTHVVRRSRIPRWDIKTLSASNIMDYNKNKKQIANIASMDDRLLSRKSQTRSKLNISL